jgi:hypothetical protein
VQVDQQHLLVGQGGQCIAEIGRDEGGAAAALAGDEGEHFAIAQRVDAGRGGDPVHRLVEGAVHQRQRQHLAHAGAHRPDQQLRLLLPAEQHHVRMRIGAGEALEQVGVGGGGIAGVHDQQFGMVRHRPVERIAHAGAAGRHFHRWHARCALRSKLGVKLAVMADQ